MTFLDRRTFVLGMAGAGVLAACGDDSAPSSGEGTGGGDNDTGSSPTDSIVAGTPAFLVPTFPDGFRADSMTVAGVEQRISFVLRDELDVMRDNAPAEINLEIARGDDVITGGSQQLRNEGISTPYYPIAFTAPEPGEYLARAVDFPEVDPIPFLVRDRAEVPLVQIGEAMREVDTPTVDDARGVDPICTRPVPCDFHDMTLTDALASGTPTVLLIATPGFCQTAICGPVLDLLIDAVADRDDLAVVHAEVFVDPNNPPDGGLPPTTETVNVYALPFEPELLVAGAEGLIVARLDTIWDRSELADALALV